MSSLPFFFLLLFDSALLSSSTFSNRVQNSLNFKQFENVSILVQAWVAVGHDVTLQKSQSQTVVDFGYISTTWKCFPRRSACIGV